VSPKPLAIAASIPAKLRLAYTTSNSMLRQKDHAPMRFRNGVSGRARRK
jgi:hypothetical protein